MMLPSSETQFLRGTARLVRDCAVLDVLTAEPAAQMAPRARLEERVGPHLAHLLIRALAPSGTQESEGEPGEARHALGSA
jgi:hypothetical protein